MNDKPSQTSPVLIGSGVFGLVALLTGCMILAFYAPVPWSKWGLAGALIGSVTLYILRFISLFTKRPLLPVVPYIAATIALLVLIMLFGPTSAGQIAAIVFISLCGLVFFYWAVWLIVEEIKSGIRHFHAWRQRL